MTPSLGKDDDSPNTTTATEGVATRGRQKVMLMVGGFGTLAGATVTARRIRRDRPAAGG
ncbi:MAG: hypothetical protein ACREGG_01145 [Candidatus Saccharimonadales bacterium]